MTEQLFVAGVDGGGTQTRAVLLDSAGTLLGQGGAGSSNYDEVGYAAARQSIAEALREAWQSSGKPSRPLDAIFLGMAGVVSQKDRDSIERMIQELGVAAGGLVSVDHDLRIALAGGLAGEPGLVLIVGTGCSCYGRRADGAEWRSGGWGSLLDDIGSAYDLGLQAIVSVVRAADGRSAPTALTGLVMKQLEIDNVAEIMHRVYVEGMGKAGVAQLAPLVIQAECDGDPIARQILARGAEELALMATTVATRLEFPAQSLDIALVGGLIQSAQGYRTQVSERIEQRLPGCRMLEPRLEPALGAALLALEGLRVTLTPQAIQELESGVNSPERTHK